MQNPFDNNDTFERTKVLICPYCHKEQNMLNIGAQMYTSNHWEAYNCDHCGRLFAYGQIVTRSYVTASVKELTQRNVKEESK